MLALFYLGFKPRSKINSYCENKKNSYLTAHISHTKTRGSYVIICGNLAPIYRPKVKSIRTPNMQSGWLITFQKWRMQEHCQNRT